jgi:hypothetical protein
MFTNLLLRSQLSPEFINGFCGAFELTTDIISSKIKPGMKKRYLWFIQRAAFGKPGWTPGRGLKDLTDSRDG